MATIGFKSKVSINDGAANAQQVFPDVVTITFPDSEVGEEETTLLDQADVSRRFIPTLADEGEFTVECQYTPALYTRVKTLRGVAKTLLATSPDPDGGGAGNPLLPQTFTCGGFVKKVGGPKAEKDKVKMFSFTFRVSGPVTIGSGTNDP